MSWRKILKFNTDEDYDWGVDFDVPHDGDEEMSSWPSHYFPNKINLDGQVWYFLTKLGDQAVYTIKRYKRNKPLPQGIERKIVSIKEAEAAKI